MKHSEFVNSNLELLNEVLTSIQASPLPESDYFVEDQSGFSSFHAIRFASEPGSNNYLPLDIYIFSDSIRIDVCDIQESFEWNRNDIQNDPDAVKHIFSCLLTGYSLFEFCGSGHSDSKLYVFDENGKSKLEVRLRGFLNFFFKSKCERHLFFPAFKANQVRTENVLS